MPGTTYLNNKLLDHAFRNTTYTPPTTVYVGLYTVAPTQAGGGTEVSGGAYARQAATFTAASNGQIKNSTDITFPIATANWGDIVAVGVFDAATGGNLLAYTTPAVTKKVLSGDQFIIRANNLVISLT